MALANYTDLKATLRDWTHRNDLPDAKLDDFIDIAEDEMYSNDVEILLIREEEKRSIANTSETSRYLALPDRFLTMRSLHIMPDVGVNIDVNFRAPEHLRVRDPSDKGMPTRFTLTSQLEFNRISDQVYTIEMNYTAGITDLSDDEPTNTVLTNHPNIYLYGSLAAANVWMNEIEMAEYYHGKFIKSIRGANKKATKGRYGPSPIMLVEGATP